MPPQLSLKLDGVHKPPGSSVEQEHASLRARLDFANQFNQSLMGIVNGDLRKHVRGIARALDQIDRLLHVYVTELQKRSEEAVAIQRPASPTSPIIVLNRMDELPMEEKGITITEIAPKVRELSAQISKVVVPKFLNDVSNDCGKVIEFNPVAPKEERTACSPRDRLPNTAFLRHVTSLSPRNVSGDPASPKASSSTDENARPASPRDTMDVAFRYALKRENTDMRNTLDKWNRTTEVVFTQLLTHMNTLCTNLTEAFDTLTEYDEPSVSRHGVSPSGGFGSPLTASESFVNSPSLARDFIPPSATEIEKYQQCYPDAFDLGIVHSSTST